MAYPQRLPPQRPPVRHYNQRPPPPPNNGWQGYGHGGYNNYDDYDGYQYGAQEGYHAQSDYGHQRPMGGPPPGREQRGHPPPQQRRPPPPGHNRPMNRPPPLRHMPHEAVEPGPRSGNSLPSRPSDGPFPSFASRKRGNSFDLGVESDMAALNLADHQKPANPPDVRPHTANSHRPRPAQHHLEPLPPLDTSRQGGWPIREPQMSANREPFSAPPEHVAPGMVPPKRSATMPVNAPPEMNKPRYPGQAIWQDPQELNRAVPPRPATTTGIRPEASTPPSVPPVPAQHRPSTAEQKDEDAAIKFIDHYLDPADGDGDSDLPNFSAMEDSHVGSSRDESLIPRDTSKEPAVSQPASKPTYTAYQPPNGIVQPYRPPSGPEPYDDSGHQYDNPSMSPRYNQQGNGYGGYPAEDPYYRPPENRGMTPRPGSARTGYTPRPQQQYPQQMPNDSGRHPSMEYRQGYHNPQEMQTGARSQYSSDPLPQQRVPFRPGLEQRPNSSDQVYQGQKPPPVRQYDNPADISPQQIPTDASLGTDPKPLTMEEFQRIQQAARSNPSDHAAQLLLAKKMVEASIYLIDEVGRNDTRAKNKAREKYIFDAHKIVKKLVHASHPDAMFYLADCYGQGLLGLQADPKEAFTLYQSAAKMGHAESAYRVAVCCEMGSEGGGGTRRDPMKAVQWYRRAAALGDTPAMYKMGMILLKGLLGQPRNPREALSWLKRAAERADVDNPHALHELALLYENPSGNDAVIRDETYAMELLHQAGELNYKFSQHRLGMAYEYGLMGCPVDARQSIFWYTRAAAQGEHQSELSLSGWYLTGAEGILQQSDTEAYLWARKAAISGLAKAEYAMGYFTEVGIGVPANLEDAKRWYWKASSQNFLKARERLEDLKRGGAKMQKTRVSRSAVNKQQQNDGECSLM